jgi:hypothetical protein
MRPPRLPHIPFLHHERPQWKTAAEEAAEAEAAKAEAAERERMKRQPMTRKRSKRSGKASDAERAIVLAVLGLVAIVIAQMVLAWIFDLPGLSWILDLWQAIGQHWQEVQPAP